MTHRLDPNRHWPEAALREAAGLLGGMERIAELCGVSKRLVEEWANPFARSVLPVWAAEVIDAACWEARGVAPFKAAMDARYALSGVGGAFGAAVRAALKPAFDGLRSAMFQAEAVLEPAAVRA